MSQLLHPNIDDHFVLYGMTFTLESDKEHPPQEVEGDEQTNFPVHADIKSVDIIYNPEYDKLQSVYRIPVFFKSTLHELDRVPYTERGFLDNGRHIVPIKDPS